MTRRLLASLALLAVASGIGPVPPAAADPPGPPLDSVLRIVAVNTDGTQLIVITGVDPNDSNKLGPPQLLDRASGQLRPFPDFVPYGPDRWVPVVSADLSAVITKDGHSWLDVATGRSTPVPAGTSIFHLTGDGRTYVAGVTDGSPGWIVDGPSGVATPLAVSGMPLDISANGRWLLIQQGCNPANGFQCDVQRVDRTTGTTVHVVRWRLGETLGSPSVADTGRVIVGNGRTLAYARDPGGRSTRLRDGTGGPMSDDGEVALGSFRPTLCCGSMFAVRLADGATDGALDTSVGSGVGNVMLTPDGRRLLYLRVRGLTGGANLPTGVQSFDLFDVEPSRAMRAGQASTVSVAGRLDVPTDAAAITLNVTVTDPAAAGFLVAWPCGGARPLAANVNFAAGAITGALVVSGIGANGTVCLSTNVDANVVVDVQGWFPASSAYRPLVPSRLADTRNGELDTTPNLPAGQQLVVSTTSSGAVPTGAAAVVVSVVATNPAAAGFVTLWPCDQPRPLAANLNFETGETRANAAIVRVAANGTMCAASNVATDLVVDAQGWFPASASFNAINPIRLADTREGQLDSTPNLPAGTPVVLRAPAGATAVALEVAATNPAAPGFVTVWPCDQSRPLASNLNFPTGSTAVANAVIAAVAADGTVCAASNVAVDLVVDLQGTFTSAADYRASTPARLLDTRLP